MHEQMDDVVGRSLLGIGGLSEAFIDELIARIAGRDYTTPQDALLEARQAIEQFEPMLADHLSDSVLAGWITGYDNVAAQFPRWLQQEFSDTIRRNPPGDPPQFDFFSSFDREPRLRLLNTEAAAKRLIERNILTREQFDAASDDARRQAFTIAGDLGDDTIERMRYFLYQDIAEGVSLTGFVNRIKENLGTSPIAPGHLETVYRTNLQAAFRDGRETLRANPIVAATFPYQEYIPIHDGRTRHEHRMLGHLGLDGTGIYRTDDPVWNWFTPPWDYNCRCGVRLLTLEQAAAAGVREAIEWLETGRAPLQPEYRFAHIPFQPNPGFGQRGNVGAIMMSVVRAPAGYSKDEPLTINGKDYIGGMFIPSDELQHATKEQKKEIKAGKKSPQKTFSFDDLPPAAKPIGRPPKSWIDRLSRAHRFKLENGYGAKIGFDAKASTRGWWFRLTGPDGRQDFSTRFKTSTEAASEAAVLLHGRNQDLKELATEALSNEPEPTLAFDTDASTDLLQQMHERYKHLSNTQLEEKLAEFDGTSRELQHVARREFNGGGRRTGPAVAAEGARDVGEEKLKLRIYLAERRNEDSEYQHDPPLLPPNAKFASKLRTIAEKLAESADGRLGQDRNTNTRKRADQAAYAIETAWKDRALADTLNNIANAQESGELRYLGNISTKQQVEDLRLAVRRATWEADRANVGHLTDRDREATPEDLQYVKFPEPYVDARLLRQFDEKLTGYHNGELYLRRLEPDDDGNVRIRTPDQEYALRELMKKAAKTDISKYELMNVAEGLKPLERLRRAGIARDTFKPAVGEYLSLAAKKKGESPTAKLEREIRFKPIPGFFPTPKPTIDRLLSMADIRAGMSVLDPSAGKGDILDRVKERHPDAKTHGVEINSSLNEILALKSHSHEHGDFRDHATKYDRIVMNPPFERGQDAEHVRQAFENNLKPGGRLVAVMSPHAFFANDRKSQDFRDWFDRHGGTVEDNENGAFMGTKAFRETGVNTKLVTLESKVEPRPDQAIVNVPLSKRGNIDAQIDRYKASQAKEAQRSRSTAAVSSRIAKAKAQELFKLHGRDIAESTAAKHGVIANEALKTLESMVKWEPERALKLLENKDGSKMRSMLF